MHKRIMYLLISLLIILSTLVAPSAAYTADDEITILYMSNTPIISTTRSFNGFEEGRLVELQFDIEYLYYEELVREQVTVFGVFEYVEAPGTGCDVEAVRMVQDFDYWIVRGLNDLYGSDYPNAIRQRDATCYYNCHSYAWYSTESDNCYWINNPYYFHWNNDYYIEVSTPAVGDIICYFDDENVNKHSGIVTAVNGQVSNGECGNSNTVEVLSKWGAAGLYQHNGYECPYTSYDNGQATTVRYYRCNHSYICHSSITNSAQHYYECSRCGKIIWENHTFKSFLDGSRRCTKCGYVSSGGNIIMSNKSKPVEK